MGLLRCAFLMLLVGCGSGHGDDGEKSTPDAGQSGSDAGGEGIVDAGTDLTADAAIACSADQTACGSSCVDTETSNAHCGACGTSCAGGETCYEGACRPGQQATANGTCTYVDQPGWLSCPTGMSCRCYYRYIKLLDDQPATLDVWISDSSVEVLSGVLPSNQTMSYVTPVTIPLAGSPKTGAVSPYRVTVDPDVVIELRKSSGYVPAKYVLYSSADCGNNGMVLECTFTPP